MFYKGTDVNQVWLKYGLEHLSGTYGRQHILHGSQRFVGGVGWRQNEQTYDGFRAMWEGSHGLTLDYAYVYNVNRIFGPDDNAPQPADWHGSNHLLRADWKIGDNHSVAGYYYGLDIDERGRWSPNLSVNNSTDTWGLEYSGKLGPFGAKAAYATQSDAGDSYQDYDADYWMLEGAMQFAGMTGTVGYEVLGADNDVGFKTPLATLHKFQGWADKFLATPGDGIEDLYVGLEGKLGAFALGAFYHDFHKNKIEDTKYTRMVEKKLADKFGSPNKIRCVLKTKEVKAKRKVEDIPLVKAALEHGARITSVVEDPSMTEGEEMR